MLVCPNCDSSFSISMGDVAKTPLTLQQILMEVEMASMRGWAEHHRVNCKRPGSATPMDFARLNL